MNEKQPNPSHELALEILRVAVTEGTLSESHKAELIGLGNQVRPKLQETIEDPKKPRELSPEQKEKMFSILEARFSSKPEHYERFEGVDFVEVKKALEANPAVMWSLYKMEETGGAPDIVSLQPGAFLFGDCSIESPNRRGLTYDQAASMAKEFGMDMMSDELYRDMQEIGKFDQDAWSWLETPANIRESGNALRGRCGWVYEHEAHTHPDLGGWRGVLRVPKA